MADTVRSYTQLVETVQPPIQEVVFDIDEAMANYELYQAKATYWLDIATRARAAGVRMREELTAAELSEIAPPEVV